MEGRREEGGKKERQKKIQRQREKRDSCAKISVREKENAEKARDG
jgi:hypothetical protein